MIIKKVLNEVLGLRLGQHVKIVQLRQKNIEGYVPKRLRVKLLPLAHSALLS